MLRQLAMSLEVFADQQHVDFRAIAPHPCVTGGHQDSSAVGCIPGNLGPRALSAMRQRRFPCIWFKLDRLLHSVLEGQEVASVTRRHGVWRSFILE